MRSTTIRSLGGLAAACMVLGLGGCHSGDQRTQAKKAAPDERGGKQVLAVVGQREITYADFFEELESLEPHLRMRFSSPERKVEFLRQLVRQELLAQEAIRRGLAKRPAVVARVKHVLAKAYLQRFERSVATLADVPEDDVRRFYDQRKADFTQPLDQVRDRIRNKLLKQLRAKAVENHVKKLRAQATINRFPQRAAAVLSARSPPAQRDAGISKPDVIP